ncbi:MAG: hypothetical protein JWP13_235, partial [Candidatus Saccharibacteria bacterium]|nr:hypothetical protein [Candidatus Saccharibacteria bacterium]
PTEQSTPASPPLEFHERPTTNFSASDCWSDSHGWAVQIDNRSEEAGRVPEDDFSVGVSQKERDPEGRPVFVAGATMRRLGSYTFELATANHKSGETTIVDLNESAFSEVQPAEEGYDVIFAARKGDDGSSYFTVNCVPEFEFFGDQVPIPVTPDMIVPPEEPSPVDITQI